MFTIPREEWVQITSKGKEASKQKIKLKDVTSDFFNFYDNENSKNIKDNEIKDSSPQDLIDSGFAAIESQVKSDLLEKLKNIDPYYFEKSYPDFIKKNGIRRFY